MFTNTIKCTRTHKHTHAHKHTHYGNDKNKQETIVREKRREREASKMRNPLQMRIHMWISIWIHNTHMNTHMNTHVNTNMIRNSKQLCSVDRPNCACDVRAKSFSAAAAAYEQMQLNCKAGTPFSPFPPLPGYPTTLATYSTALPLVTVESPAHQVRPSSVPLSLGLSCLFFLCFTFVYFSVACL